ncbi:rhodanese-like domain-containing protein [Chengkuizengella axinellae]|uniref:Rhodanese-like domain-containing protein n=1 Tax=Chengkuizengella axinellae TaxID=3064388 RepID=A0ABT9J525_9BACL|nr:rhodanese-like domain-containing protein [Chengkuizengella sp. 2205SS18-9]MDP5276678.1 rhodanese-like domain-containing protein [Chengkuizengella sp. 2205SS18-9]
MDIVSIVIIAGIILIFILQRRSPKGVKQITTSQLKLELEDSNKQFIDVRSTEEYRRNHIKKFKNIPLHEVSKKGNGLSKEKEVVVICQSGARSQQASRILKKQGFKQITNVKGGLSSW